MTITDDKESPPPPANASRSGSLRTSDRDSQHLIEDVGGAVIFIGKILRALPEARSYMSEVLRQAGILIISSSAIIWTLMMVLGAEGSLEGHYLLRQLGAADYTAIFTSTGEYSAGPSIFGWILAAKVGCGLVAELGSMRISEEIDALEVMGIGSLAYLVSTRILAIFLVMPFLLIVGFGLMFLTSHVLSIYFFHSVSAGGYETVFWTFMTQMDFLGAVACSMLMGVGIVIVGCYYGYTASGGPVGVGRNTAKSMIINMVVVAVIGVISQRLFFGGLTRAPIGH
ncbi:ABC transporter permease [Frankia sp. CiP1_Cm_nod2]|uniref:ABC transporter permease n=1 Tax=Frankia sp. CiP1_Cm_nod2 TaxID=2897161 RepID=UPI002025303B